MISPSNLIKSIGLRTEVIAQALGVEPQTIRAWSCGAVAIPDHRRAQLLDLKEAVRQIVNETSGYEPL